MFKRRPRPSHTLPVGMRYCTEAPTNQTMVDILRGEWFSAFPEEYQVSAGGFNTFNITIESRVKWGNDVLAGRLTGSAMLELGPFEAYDTWQMELSGARSVVAIENNNINFIKCLIVKEMMGLKSHFLFGDFIPYLENCSQRFDIVWASGVLYHQTEPLKLLGLISKVTDTVFIHTHYYLEDFISRSAFYSDFKPERDVEAEYGDFRARLHYRSYKRELKSMASERKAYAGGAETFSYWMDRSDIFACLQNFGFDKFTLGVEDQANPMGPAMYFIAEKNQANPTGQ